MTLVVLTSHKLSHFTRTWSGEKRYSIINVCQILPRKTHLIKQQAQGVETTDPEEIELLRPKKSKKRDDDSDDNDNEEKEEKRPPRIDALNLPDEPEEQDTTSSSNQTVGGESTSRRQNPLMAKLTPSTSSTAPTKKTKFSNLYDGEEATPVIALNGAPKGVEEGDEAWPITILDDETASDIQIYRVENIRMGDKSVSVIVLDD